MVKGRIYEEWGLAVIGTYEPDKDFGGTDRLSMGVVPDFLDYLEAEGRRCVLWEGDRLCSPSIFSRVESRVSSLVAVSLQCEPSTLQSRRTKRDTDPDPSWLKSRETKCANMDDQLAGVLEWENDTPRDLRRNAGDLAGLIRPDSKSAHLRA